MPAAAAKKTYTATPVTGSLAYDIAQPEEEAYFYSLPREAIANAPRIDEEVVQKTRAVPRQAIAPAAVLGFALAAALLVVVIFAHVGMSAASENVLALEHQVEELQKRQDDLLIDYETAFNLTELEDYAINELGMQKPRSDQIYFINSTAEDKAVVLSERAESVSLVDRLGDFLSSIAEYFG